jgi:triacylglycerol lipase
MSSRKSVTDASDDLDPTLMKRALAALTGLTSKPEQIRAVGREALAFARQATLLHRDVTATYPRLASPGDDVVVLLHGLFATAGVLREAVERVTGAHTASFTYAPGPGVARIAETLAELVDRLPSGVRIHLVGHSMGGIAARWFVQELGGDPRVVGTLSLASPFQGTRRARLVPGASGRDIGIDSAVLSRIRERGECGVPHLSVIAGRDVLVTEEASLPHGRRIVIGDSGHNGLLFHPRVAEIVTERVMELRERCVEPTGPRTGFRIASGRVT